MPVSHDIVDSPFGHEHHQINEPHTHIQDVVTTREPDLMHHNDTIASPQNIMSFDVTKSSAQCEKSDAEVVQSSHTIRPPQRTHGMRARLLDEIVKSKIMMVTKHPLPHALQTALAPIKPTCYSQAVKFTE